MQNGCTDISFSLVCFLCPKELKDHNEFSKPKKHVSDTELIFGCPYTKDNYSIRVLRAVLLFGVDICVPWKK